MKCNDVKMRPIGSLSQCGVLEVERIRQRKEEEAEEQDKKVFFSIQVYILIIFALFHESCRELFIRKKAMVLYVVQLSTYFRIGFWYNGNKICTVIKLSSPQLVDNCTYGAIAFPCTKSSLNHV